MADRRHRHRRHRHRALTESPASRHIIVGYLAPFRLRFREKTTQHTLAKSNKSARRRSARASCRRRGKQENRGKNAKKPERRSERGSELLGKARAKQFCGERAFLFFFSFCVENNNRGMSRATKNKKEKGDLRYKSYAATRRRAFKRAPRSLH